MIVLRNVPQIRIAPQFGWIPDPVDVAGKDVPLSSTPMASGALGTVQDEMDLSCFFRPISDQMQFPSCTANACADAWEAMCVIDKVDGGMALQTAIDSTPDLSRMFLWWCGRNEMAPNQALNAASGCYNRLIMDVIARHGVPAETLWPYDNAQIGPGGEPRSIVRPSIKSFRAAIVNASGAFYNISEEGEDRHNLLLQALGARHLPVLGTALEQSFMGYKDGIVRTPTGAFVGRHAMVIVGWSAAKQAYKLRNSWSPYWGQAGYCWVSKGYVLSSITGGLWVATKGVL